MVMREQETKEKLAKKNVLKGINKSRKKDER